MMQEHMNVEECQALDSTPFMLIVSISYTPFVRHFGIISLHLITYIMSCCVVLNCFANIYLSEYISYMLLYIFEYILPYNSD